MPLRALAGRPLGLMWRVAFWGLVALACAPDEQRATSLGGLDGSSIDGAACTADCAGQSGAPDASALKQPVSAYVDPFIGTAGEGNTFPGAVAPWGMVSVSPHNVLSTPMSYLEDEPIAPSGYLFGRPRIMGFGLTHLSGTGCPDLGAPVVMPTAGAIETAAAGYASEYQDEVASPGYFAVALNRHGIEVEATATQRAGLLRFHFPEHLGMGNVIIDVGENLSWADAGGQVQVLSDTEVEGYAETGLFCFQSNQQRVYFSGRFNRSALETGTWSGDALSTDSRAAGRAGAWFRFQNQGRAESATDADPAGHGALELQVGISYVSADNARANLEAEVGDNSFEDIRGVTEAEWESQLSRIRIRGGEEAQRQIFYTALYHCLLHPNVFSDVNGEYPLRGRDTVDVAEGYTRHTVFSMWDTYRTLHPLLSLVYPDRQADMARSIAALTLENGRAPKWELAGYEANPMVGDPALPVIVDSYLKGFDDFAVDDVYQVLRAGAMDASGDDPHRPGAESYQRLGYIPMEEAEQVWGPVSTTLEYAYADWALAGLAEALGRHDDARVLNARATGYRTLFHARTGLLRPKNADGTWYEPFDPNAIEGSRPYRRSGGPGYVEGTAWHYAFFAPHDIEELATLHGGGEAFVQRLWEVFDRGHFTLWNEPDMAYPYLFTQFSGNAWRAQEQVREAMHAHFHSGPQGLPGNDDAGTLSAWYVFSALGLYPAHPASGVYRLGLPLFEEARVKLHPEFYSGQDLVISALPAAAGPAGEGPGPGKGEAGVETGVGGDRTAAYPGTSVLSYVQRIRWNHIELARPAIGHADLVSGGRLAFEMSSTPSHGL